MLAGAFYIFVFFFVGAEFKREIDPSNLEWLPSPSRVSTNLKPDGSGWVDIPANTINASHNLVQIIAVDEDNTSLRNVILQAGEAVKTKDCRLSQILNKEKHFAEQVCDD